MLSIEAVQREMPSYNIGKDDLNPMFDYHGRCLNPFPYTQQNNLSTKKSMKTYDTVVLENDWLSVALIPELGGRVIRIYDKSACQDVFYYNDEIKPELVGTRGAWFAGGIEFNTPISHSPTSFDKVNYSISKDDRSVRVVMGAIERISHMYWEVEMSLRADDARIRQRVKIMNPTASENRFYFWTNAAVSDSDDLKLLYPFDWCVNHIEDYYMKWPVYNGIDFSVAKDIPHIYEAFGKLLTRNYFGIHYASTGNGIIHYADRNKVKGAKFFAWGKNDSGRSWNRALTNSDDEYLEIQSGLFETQSFFGFTEPFGHYEWEEFWYPVNNMSNIVHADKTVAVGMTDNAGRLQLDIYSAVSHGEVTVELSWNGKTLKERLDLRAHETMKTVLDMKSVLGTGIDAEEIAISIRKEETNLLVSGGKKASMELYPDEDLFTDTRMNRDSGRYDQIILDIRDEKELPDSDVEILFNIGRYKESRGEEKDALICYERNLISHPQCPLTKKRLAGMLIKMEEYDRAKKLLKQVLVYDNRDDEARFKYALSSMHEGNLTAAKYLLTDICSDKKVQEQAAILRGRIHVMMDEYEEASELIKGLELQGEFACLLEMIAKRRLGISHETRETEETNPWIRAEQYLRTGDKTYLKSFADNSDQYLMVSQMYLSLRQYEDVIRLIDAVDDHGLLLKLYDIYAQSKMSPIDVSHELKRLLDVSELDYAFFKDKVTADVIRTLSEYDSTGKMAYLLGNYCYANNRMDKSLSLFEEAYEKGLRYTVLLKNLAYIHKKNGDADTAVLFCKEDMTLNPGTNTGTLELMTEIAVERKQKDILHELLELWQNVNADAKVSYGSLKCLMNLGLVEEGLDYIRNNDFFKWEGKKVVEDHELEYCEKLMSLAKDEEEVLGIKHILNFE